MFDIDDTLRRINIFLNKLILVIENQASFTWLKFKLINKNKIDDVVCCIEANFPNEYKEIVKKHGAKNFSAYYCYLKLIENLRRKSKFFPSCYHVKYREALRQIQVLKSSMRADLKKTIESNPTNF